MFFFFNQKTAYEMRISDLSSDVCSSDLVVAHFHYVLSLGAVFALFAGRYYWFGKMWGKMYNEVLGQLHFWIFFIGVNILFFPMHFLGLDGMPRRYPDYPDAFAGWNHLASIGYVVMAIGMALFFINVIWSLIDRKSTRLNSSH